MATITRNISTKVNTSGEAEILLRLTVSRSLRLRLKKRHLYESKTLQRWRDYYAES